MFTFFTIKRPHIRKLADNLHICDRFIVTEANVVSCICGRFQSHMRQFRMLVHISNISFQVSHSFLAYMRPSFFQSAYYIYTYNAVNMRVKPHL